MSIETRSPDAVSFAKNRYLMIHDFLDGATCDDIVARVREHKDRGGMIEVNVDTVIAKQRFHTVNGEELEALVPEVKSVNERLNALARELTGWELAPLTNKTVGMSLNLTQPGGTLSWHYDRNLVTAVVYLNEVEGGNIEIYPRYRVRIEDNHRGLRKAVQRLFDLALRPGFVRKVLGREVSLQPRRGSICIMDASCLHQVQTVEGEKERAAIILCYDRPGKVFAKTDTRNYYGYRDQKHNLLR